MNEKKETFENILNVLKIKYKFNPKNFMCYFQLSKVQAIQKISEDLIFIAVFSIILRVYGEILKI